MFQERGISFEFILDEGLAVLVDMAPGVKGQVAMLGVAEKGRVTLDLTYDECSIWTYCPMVLTIGLFLQRQIRWRSRKYAS
jgi:hypothetical protein